MYLKLDAAIMPLRYLKTGVAAFWFFYWGCLAFHTPANAALFGLCLCLLVYTILQLREQQARSGLGYRKITADALRSFSGWPLVAAWLFLCLIAIYPVLFTPHSKSVVRYWLLAPPASYIAFRMLGWTSLRLIVLGACCGFAIAGALYVLQILFPALDIKMIRNSFGDRFSLFFQHPNDMSALIAWVVIVLLYCRLNGQRIFHRQADWLLLPPLLLLMFFGYSRGPQLALAAVAGALLIYKFRPGKKKLLVSALLLVGIFTVMHNLPLTNNYLLNRFLVLTRDPMSGSMSSRMPIWEAAVYGIKKNPVIGHGIHGFYAQHQEFIKQNYAELRKKYPVVETRVGTAHNLLLTTAHDAGLVGLGLFLFITVTLLRRSCAHPAPANMVPFGLLFCFLTGITESGLHEPWFIAIFFSCGTAVFTSFESRLK
jgi:O-antigen ligase